MSRATWRASALGRHLAFEGQAWQIEAAKPAIGQVQMHLFTEPPLRADAKAIANWQHADQRFWIDRQAASVALEICEMRADTGQINEPIN